MGKIFATCGHEIPEVSAKYHTTVAEYDRVGDRVLSYQVTCLDCQENYRNWGILLESEEQEKAWLEGRLEIYDNGENAA